MAGNDRARPFSSRKKDVKLTVVASIGCTPYTAPAYGQTCVRTLPSTYAVVNSTTRNWARLTSKHPQSPQKMGEVRYGRIPKGFVLFLILGRRADHPMIFHIFPYLFYHRFLVSNCLKFCVKRIGSTVAKASPLACGCKLSIASNPGPHHHRICDRREEGLVKPPFCLEK